MSSKALVELNFKTNAIKAVSAGLWQLLFLFYVKLTAVGICWSEKYAVNLILLLEICTVLLYMETNTMLHLIVSNTENRRLLCLSCREPKGNGLYRLKNSDAEKRRQPWCTMSARVRDLGSSWRNFSKASRRTLPLISREGDHSFADVFSPLLTKLILFSIQKFRYISELKDQLYGVSTK